MSNIIFDAVVPTYDKTINWDGEPCRICGHSRLTHSKYDRSGGLDEKCHQRAIVWDALVRRFAIGRCKCIGYQPPKPKYKELRCTVCSKPINQFQEIGKDGLRRCKYCNAVFGNDGEFRTFKFREGYEDEKLWNQPSDGKELTS